MISKPLKDTFSGVIGNYEWSRPRYPAELYHDIEAFATLSPGASLLEVGAGTGQATELFLSKGYRLDLLEVSDAQVSYLNHKYADDNVQAHKAYFDEYNSEQKYDLIYSATAFHWVKAEIGYPKAWSMLKEGGTMAVFWQMSSVTYHDEGLFVGLDEIKKRYLPDESLGFDREGIESVRQRRINQIQSGGCFGMPVMKEYRWTDTYDADRYAALIDSYSSTQLLEEEARHAYLQEIREYVTQNGGVISMPQHVMLYMMKKHSSI